MHTTTHVYTHHHSHSTRSSPSCCQTDIDSLVHQCNVHNILWSANLTSATLLVNSLGVALEGKWPEMIPSFFSSLRSPATKVYGEGRDPAAAAES